MKYAVLVVGIPGSGKTSLTRGLIEHLEYQATSSRVDISTKLVPFRFYRLKDSTWKVIGVFNDKPTSYAEGTDKLSMGVQPEFEKFCAANKACLFIEGDRLANQKTLMALLAAGYRVKVIELMADQKVLQIRYKERRSTQSETFIKGRATKVKNLLEVCIAKGIQVYSKANNTQKDASWIKQRIITLMH